MKKPLLFLIFTLALSGFGCKKFIEQQEKNALIKVMTDGVWVVSGYKENGTDITSDFSGYVFKFKADGSVVGTMGANSTTGTWTGDVNTRSITSAFPSGDTLQKLNATWKITDSYNDSVAAKTTINSYTNILNLKKH